MRRRVSLLGAVIALVVAGVAVGTAPDSSRITAPMYVTGPVGEVVSARLLSAEVASVEVTDVIEIAYRSDTAPIPTTGVWVVVTATVTPTTDVLNLGFAELRVGDARYRVSDAIPAPTLQNNAYGAGIAMRGELAFELPASALGSADASRAEIVFSPSFLPTLDTVPVVTFDLGALDTVASVRIDLVTLVERP